MFTVILWERETEILYGLCDFYRYNRINAISMACRTGVKGCSELTSMWYRQWMKSPDRNPYGKHFSKPEVWNQSDRFLHSYSANSVEFSSVIRFYSEFSSSQFIVYLYHWFKSVQFTSFQSVYGSEVQFISPRNSVQASLGNARQVYLYSTLHTQW